MENQLKKLKLDRRMQSFNMKTGALTKDELDKHLKTLEDCSDRAKSIKISTAADTSIN